MAGQDEDLLYWLRTQDDRSGSVPQEDFDAFAKLDTLQKMEDAGIVFTDHPHTTGD